MTNNAIRSIRGVCEVRDLRGPEAGAPTLLLEVPHGATRLAEFTALRDALRGEFPDGLQDFFCVNTDVGTPELALRVAELHVAAAPKRRALVVRSEIPRTFVDCNRVIDVAAVPGGAAGSEMTPGLHAWVRHPEDRRELLERYAAYVAVARAAFEATCGSGGLALMVHSYAPRSIDVPIDERIVERLRAEYAPDRIEKWPLRAEVDLLANGSDGERIASAALTAAAQESFARAGYEVAVCRTYALHKETLAHVFARAFPDRTLCLEIRRDLLVREFTPFAEMRGEPAKVERAAAALAEAVDAADGAR